MHNSVMTVVTEPQRDSDIPILDMMSISGGVGLDVLCGPILADMS